LPLPASNVETAILARVHHELKTPLFSILTSAEILRQTSHPNWHWVVDILEKNAGNLRTLIEDLLLYADLARGDASIHPEALDLQELLAEARDQRSAAADKNRVTFESFAEGPIPKVRADKRLARAVVGHLVDNAVKFNREGGRVEASWSDLGESVELSIANTGEPIPDSDRHTIFEPFIQLEDVLTRAHGGIGLGLAIVRKGLEALGGSVASATLPDGRNLFSIRLPKA
jgi:signal transduction histidine kinase